MKAVRQAVAAIQARDSTFARPLTLKVHDKRHQHFFNWKEYLRFFQMSWTTLEFELRKVLIKVKIRQVITRYFDAMHGVDI